MSIKLPPFGATFKYLYCLTDPSPAQPDPHSTFREATQDLIDALHYALTGSSPLSPKYPPPPDDISRWDADSEYGGHGEYNGGWGEYGTPPAQGCAHEWRKYSGFTENYEYCTKCDKKGNINE